LSVRQWIVRFQATWPRSRHQELPGLRIVSHTLPLVLQPHLVFSPTCILTCRTCRAPAAALAGPRSNYRVRSAESSYRVLPAPSAGPTQCRSYDCTQQCLQAKLGTVLNRDASLAIKTETDFQAILTAIRRTRLYSRDDVIKRRTPATHSMVSLDSIPAKAELDHQIFQRDVQKKVQA